MQRHSLFGWLALALLLAFFKVFLASANLASAQQAGLSFLGGDTHYALARAEQGVGRSRLAARIGRRVDSRDNDGFAIFPGHEQFLPVSGRSAHPIVCTYGCSPRARRRTAMPRAPPPPV